MAISDNCLPEHPTDSSDMLSRFQHTLTAFAASRDTFRIINTLTTSSIQPGAISNDLPSPSLPVHHDRPRTLHILDASFNPPTLAHRHLALQSLKLGASKPRQEAAASEDKSRERTTLLLLLATQNADKPPAPAGFPDRLAMMGLLGEDILHEYSQVGGKLDVLVAVTKHAKFVDKATAIATFYDEVEGQQNGRDGESIGRNAEDISRLSSPDQPEQIWLTGYDTLERILAPKYYLPGNLSALDPFFGKCKVRMMARIGFGTEGDVVEKLRNGELEEVGGRKEWQDRIEFLEGLKEDVSSTNVRRAVKEGRREDVAKLVGPRITTWVATRDLYK